MLEYKKLVSMCGLVACLSGCGGATMEWQYENDSNDGLIFLHANPEQDIIYYFQDSPSDEASLTLLDLEGDQLKTYPLPNLVDEHEIYELKNYSPYSLFRPSFEFIKLSSGAFVVYQLGGISREITDFYYHNPVTNLTWDSLDSLDSISLRDIAPQSDGSLVFIGLREDESRVEIVVDEDGAVLNMLATQVAVAETSSQNLGCRTFDVARDSDGNRYSITQTGITACSDINEIIWERDFDNSEYYFGSFQDNGQRVDMIRVNDRNELEVSRTVYAAGVIGLEVDASFEAITSGLLGYSFTVASNTHIVHELFSLDGMPLLKIDEKPNERRLKLPPYFGEWFGLNLSEGDPEVTGGCRFQDSLSLKNGAMLYATRHCNAASNYGVNLLSFYRR